jgi:hypothetical protein
MLPFRVFAFGFGEVRWGLSVYPEKLRRPDSGWSGRET